MFKTLILASASVLLLSACSSVVSNYKINYDENKNHHDVDQLMEKENDTKKFDPKHSQLNIVDNEVLNEYLIEIEPNSSIDDYIKNIEKGIAHDSH